MKAQELRIGNFYSQYGDVIETNWVTIKNLSNAPDGQLWCKPITLTEEWLVNFGFNFSKYHYGEDDGYGDVFEYSLDISNFKLVYTKRKPFKSDLSNKDTIDFILEADGVYEYCGEFNLLDKIKYIHQLQNLYFALTGEELTIEDAKIPNAIN
jgi:hypothetical protein